MGMHGIELIYWVCFFLGFGFAVVSGLLAGVFSGGHVGVGHGDLGHGGHGDGAAGHGDGLPLGCAEAVSSTLIVTRPSMVGIVVTQSGQTSIREVPTSSSTRRAS